MSDINEIKLKLESMKGFGSITKGEILVLLTTVEQYEMAVTQQQEAFKDQGKEILKYRNELESQKEEIEQKDKFNVELAKQMLTLEQQISTFRAWQPNSWDAHLQIESLKAITELAVNFVDDLSFLISMSECSPNFHIDSKKLIEAFRSKTGGTK